MKSILTLLTILFSLTVNADGLEAFYMESSQRILFAGENHRDDLSREKLQNSLVQFRASGGDTLGLEMVESNKQYLLDNFINLKENSTIELSNYLTVRWQYNTESYMELISAARQLGIGLLAIDLDRTKRPVETALFPVPPETSKVRAAREEHMAKVLCSSNYQRIIVIIGSFHAKKKFLPKQIINECSLRSSSFNLSTLKT